ncbi:toll/interleukin-1 receptor domain-containing protein [Paenibacillus caseinilyticus]|uniref:SEFIR domain-containing protein n=1 Tax=Paenibacillus mucilaginosus K02 TaxID=997761 RepID=I0BDY1_9BACL|nr:SEFIR domain-containing protein [Paenibacillus mucilaginosus]AFH60578.1 hypothetical protein B2K_07560 [Paenibacillus mucilaginosus K02]
MDQPKAAPTFISYAWSSPEHQRWVIELAERLENDGVEVKIDVWDLKEGHNKYAFMESMVTSPSIERILVICDKVYKEKADQRKGGVGTETQIISPELYENVTQEKIIPIIAEVDEEGRAYVPIYCKSNIYIDLSSQDQFEQEYEKLVRNLYNKPMHRRPERGKAPAYINENSISTIKEASINNQLKDAYTRAPQRVKGLTRQFLDEFLLTLKQFEYQSSEDKTIDEIVYSNVHNMLPLRNEFVRFIEQICDNQENLPLDNFITFFEQFYLYTQPNINDDEEQCDHYKFFIRETFIFLVMVLIDKRRFEEIASLTMSSYFIGERQEPMTFTEFCQHTYSLDERRKRRLQNRLFSNSAEILIRERATDRYNKSRIVEADLLLYHISKKFNHNEFEKWFPYTYVYRNGENLSFFTRLQSQNFALEAIKLFKCQSILDLKNYIENQIETDEGYGLGPGRLPRLRDLIPPEKLAVRN